MSLKQEVLFPTEKAVSFPPVTLRLSGLGPIPSFKNNKRSMAWIDQKHRPPQSMFYQGSQWLKKNTIRLMARPITEQETKDWMQKATDLFELQLLSALEAGGVQILTAASAHSLIATLLPCDDSWREFRHLTVVSEKCDPGQEGAEITIQPL